MINILAKLLRYKVQQKRSPGASGDLFYNVFV